MKTAVATRHPPAPDESPTLPAASPSPESASADAGTVPKFDPTSESEHDAEASETLTGTNEQRGEGASERQTFARFADAEGSDDWRPVEKQIRLGMGKRIPNTRYRLTSWLGEGGMGEVFEAEHVDIERSVAIKVIKHGADAALAERFIDEARTIARVESRFVVDVLDFGELPDGRPFYAMELLRDLSLHSVLEDYGRLPLERALPILRQLCKALEAIHTCGLAHRDLKPENVLLQLHEGNREDMVRVVDFGIAAEFKAQAELIAGTPPYMAPEQIMGEGFDGRLDIYALGCLAYEMISGETPFQGKLLEIFDQHLEAQPDSLTGRLPDLPEELDEVLTRCLAKRPEDRYASAAELEAALCEIQIAAGFTTPWDDLALPPVDEERREQLAASMPRPRIGGALDRRVLIGAGVVAALLAVLVIVGLATRSRPDPQQQQVVNSRKWVEDYAAEARAAGAQAYWVYPPPSDREFKTAQTWVLAIEERAAPKDYIAWSYADLLRAEFAATLIRLGDEYWDKDHGRPFAVEYYAQALIFDPDNKHAGGRVALTNAQLADAGARAARGEFSEAELAAGEMLAALAERDEGKRRKKVRSIVQDPKRGPGGAHTQGLLVDLVGEDELRAEIEEAAAAAAVPGIEETGSKDSAADRQRARALAKQGNDALAKGKRDKAERLFHKAIAADSRNASAVEGLARIHFDLGAYGEALGYAKKASRLRPRDEGVRLLLGDAYLKVLRYSNARAEYEKAQALGSPLAKKRLARLDELTR
ncbi:serine/threonine protein kinase [Plesiocystis pacifica SIR-1]|uniref:Serine/threonine protein kinase n=1 Tax=Plesiocystis pacifica SIR-1 TaxID=391625 RepID=A6GAY7_9BACT|nr:serine/threonine protein kinase [Plesiocystis pacifica SIR-1]